jgi:phosphinothricin acetyltransferase
MASTHDDAARRVVPARREHLPAVAAVYNQAVAERWATADLDLKPDRHFEDWWAAHPPDTYPVYVCEEDGRVLGWCSLSAYRPGRAALREVAEVSVYVDAGQRGRGVGSALLGHALSDARRLGLRILFAIVIDGNEASLALLRRHGFGRWGFLPDVVNVDGVLRGQVYLGRRV